MSDPAVARTRAGTEGLSDISRRTLAHYSATAESFWENTRDHDVSQNYEAFLGAIGGAPPFRILDLGCGPGRDLVHFKSLGHEVTGLDGCETFVRMAHERSGAEVWHQDFLDLDLPSGAFDGICANAVLFHVPARVLPDALARLRRALKPRGVLFSSNPRGKNEEGWNGPRYGSYHDLAAWTGFLTEAGFELIDHYFRPEGRPREEQPWLATLARRRG